MLKQVREKRPGKKKIARPVRLYACAARVFVETDSVTAGEEALVFTDGGCMLLLEQFIAILETYAGKANVTIQVDEKSLRMFSTALPVSNYTNNVKPPAHFVVGRVTDTWVSGQNR